MCHICADYDCTMIVSCMYYRENSAAVSPALANDSKYLNKMSLLKKGYTNLLYFKELPELSPFCLQACLVTCKQVLWHILQSLDVNNVPCTCSTPHHYFYSTLCIGTFCSNHSHLIAQAHAHLIIYGNILICLVTTSADLNRIPGFKPNILTIIGQWSLITSE
jgi:hypothetical protein